jgi:hypothetical protein
MTVFALAGIHWSPLVLLTVSLLIAFLLRLVLEDVPDPAAPERSARLARGLALALMTLAVIGALLASASSAATSPDLIEFWGPKAQAFAEARTFDRSLLADPIVDYMHPSYPPLVTNLYAFASMAAGRLAWGAATITSALCLAVLALALPGLLRGICPDRAAVAASAFVVAALGFLTHNLFSAGNGDPWLWIYEIPAMALLVGSAGVTSSGLLLAGLCIAGAISAKVEGLAFAIPVIALFLILRRREIRVLPAAAFLILPGVISLGAWLAFGATRGLFRGYEQYGSFVKVHWEKLGPVLSSLGGAFWSAGWALPWLIPLAAMIAAPRKRCLALLPVGVSAALAVFYVFTYLHQEDAGIWIQWSAGRIFAPILAFLVIGSVGRPIARE